LGDASLFLSSHATSSLTQSKKSDPWAGCVMRYLLDGYNLLHAMGILCGKVGPRGLEQARLSLLSRLHGVLGDDAGIVTVVFDAANAPPGAVAEDEYRGIHIRYARDGEADDVIESLIQSEATPRRLTIVSDDHRVQQAGRRRRCPVLGCLDYLEEMERLRHRQPEVAEAPVKPEGMSEEETRHWLREFADLVDDPKVREALGPDFEEIDGK
jgi:predicted RNA-binding protein with PIN domain